MRMNYAPTHPCLSLAGPGAQAAGPAVVISFIIASLCCLCSAFCYAEFAARVPVSGSAYTFTYVCLGEFAAWFVVCILVQTNNAESEWRENPFHFCRD